MWLFSLIFATAILPPLVLIGFFLSHYRRRLGLKLGAWAFTLGVASASVAIALALFLLRVTPTPDLAMFSEPEIALIVAAMESAVGAAIPEEFAKFLMLWFVIRRFKDCDSGGDLFCSAILVGLGFATIENVLYLFAAGTSWPLTGLVRGLMAVPCHTIDGMFMGYFLALWWRKALSTPVALALALLLPMLAHGLYDFPLVAMENLRQISGADVYDLYVGMRFLQVAVLAVSGLAAIWVARCELVEVYSDMTPDADLHRADAGLLRRWRRVGWLLTLGGCLTLFIGASVWSQGESIGAFLTGVALFPLAFGVIMRMRPPERVANPYALQPTAAAWD